MSGQSLVLSRSYVKPAPDEQVLSQMDLLNKIKKNEINNFPPTCFSTPIVKNNTESPHLKSSIGTST